MNRWEAAQLAAGYVLSARKALAEADKGIAHDDGLRRQSGVINCMRPFERAALYDVAQGKIRLYGEQVSAMLTRFPAAAVDACGDFVAAALAEIESMDAVTGSRMRAELRTIVVPTVGG